VRVGDAVVALFGYQTPYILRPVKETSAYQMINVAYVSGHGDRTLSEHARSACLTNRWRDFAAEGCEEYAIV
jgi:hypothetical protein